MNQIARAIIIAVLASILLPPTNSLADYVSTSFADLAGTSDVIIVGVIDKVVEKTIDVKVEDWIAGPGKVGDTILIRKFQDWACARRWEKYAVGQKLLMFLAIDKEHTADPYVIRGAADEGESLVMDDEVNCNFFVPGRAVERGMIAVQLDKLRKAIADFRSAYRITPTIHHWRQRGDQFDYIRFESIERIAAPPAKTTFRPRYRSADEMIPFERRSPWHKFLAETVAAEQKKIEKYKE